uniref:E3 ubiquitin-protein ligase HERC2 n=1 Tax=Magallana gigas TaxID=29159 RepID=A0A8W8I5N5_MAGGI
MESGIKGAEEMCRSRSSIAARENTSSSLGEEGFSQMKEAFTDILDEYANHQNIDENVAVITCGRHTEFQRYYSNHYEDIKQALDITRHIGKKHPIFCIPVGRNPDLRLLEFISAQSRGGKMINFRESKQFAKYSLNTKIASNLSFTMENDGNDRGRILTSLVCTFPEKVFTEIDLNDIYEICSKKFLYQPIDENTQEEKDAYEERDPRMPSLGSRVKRGRDWRYPDQDKFGPGTVIGHSKRGLKPDKFDVQVCNEPRILNDELIATGCNVTRGPDWVWNDQDGGTGNIGSVLRVGRDGIVLVQWENGRRGTYRFGNYGFFDLKLDPFSPEVTRYHLKKAALTSSVETEPCTKEDQGLASKSSNDKTVEKTKKPILHVAKGKYFRNDIVSNKPSDIDTDGPTYPCTRNQWLWKDDNGQWNQYSREVNARINQSYKRDPNSSVIVTIQDKGYRVVMAKSKQINLATREIAEVKLLKNDSSP